jgi:hypothetical protein
VLQAWRGERVRCRYGVVSAMSVSKWIHLNHGDDGIMAVFRRCFQLLKVQSKLLHAALCFMCSSMQPCSLFSLAAAPAL